MKCLLDTHTLIWFFFQSKKIPSKTLRLVENSEQVFVSTISLWEISMKFATGKLRMKQFSPEELVHAAKEQHFDILTLSEADALGFRNVPRHAHPDPFDRMLIWQAICRELTLVSAEQGLNEYSRLGLKWLW
jgi:PIN domain nuclease of toxin-antitoxin system